MDALKEINPLPITGHEKLEEFLEKAFTAHLSREIKNTILKSFPDTALKSPFELPKLLKHFKHCSSLRPLYKDLNFSYEEILTAYGLIKKWIESDYVIFLAFAGALTPAGFGTNCLIPLIERKIIDVIATTGANIFHEIQRTIGEKFYEYDLSDNQSAIAEKDIILAEQNFSRIYNIIFPERSLFVTGDFIINNIMPNTRLLAMVIKNNNISFSDYSRIIGLTLQEKFPKQKNWFTLAKNYHIPILCGAPQDSSISLPNAFYQLIKKPTFNFDINHDVNEMAALQYLAQKQGKFAVVILGGGVPKNFTLQGEPYLKDVCGLPEIRGFDGDLQISLADVRDGGLSSCPANEGHTWGKVSDKGIKDSLYVKGEILSIFPLLVYEICRQNLKKKSKIFLDKHLALKALEQNVKCSFHPMTTEEYDILIRKK